MTRIGILVYDEVEVLDACGPFEVFSVARRLQLRDAAPAPIEVTLVSAYADRAVVVARGGLRIVSDAPIDAAGEFDLLLVPGGVTAAMETDRRVLDWVAARAATPTIASVCTGAFILAEAGILRDQTVTTHWEDQAELRTRFPALEVIGDRRWVEAGHVFTSAGISAGLDLALHLVDRIEPGLAPRVARQMDYEWRER